MRAAIHGHGLQWPSRVPREQSTVKVGGGRTVLWEEESGFQHGDYMYSDRN